MFNKASTLMSRGKVGSSAKGSFNQTHAKGFEILKSVNRATCIDRTMKQCVINDSQEYQSPN